MKRITRTLATASQLILAAPVRLPPKVVAIAKYVSLGAALLEAVIRPGPNEDDADGVEGASPPGHELPAYRPGRQTRAILGFEAQGVEAPGDGH